MKRIFDCFTFFNELDLLELRLSELYPSVDYFVLAESPITFQGQRKDLVYAQHKSRFAKFQDKIIHLVVDDFPVDATAWGREHFQRNALRRGLGDAADEDVIIISDADEILRPSSIQKLRASSGFTQINMPMYQYYMNLRESENGWSKVFAYSYRLQQRLQDYNWARTNQQDVYQSFAGENQKIFDGGWHFTYLGGPARIREKLRAFSHDEAWFAHMLNTGGIESHVAAGYVVGNFWHLAEFCEIDSSFPIHVRANLGKYRDLGYIRNPLEALRDMQQALRNAHQFIRQQHQQIASGQGQ